MSEGGPAPAAPSMTVATEIAVRPAPPRRSLLRYSPALVLMAIAVADAGRFADPDLWGHLLAGSSILRTGHLPLHDPYSYTAPNFPWYDHEAIAEAWMALWWAAGGIVGLKLMKLVSTAVTILALALSEAESGAPPTLQFAILITAAVALGPQLQFRTQMVTFAFSAASIALIARDNYGRRAPLWLMVPLMALWTVAHGGFVVGLGLLTLYSTIAGLRDIYEGGGTAHGLRLGTLTAAAWIATAAVPGGLRNWHEVIVTFRNPMTHGLIQEWQPLITVMMLNHASGHSGLTLYLVILGLMAAFVVSFALTPRAGDLPLVMIAALMIVAAFVSVRNMALAVITIACPLARHAHLVLVWIKGPAGERERTGEGQPTGAGEASAAPGSSRQWWINQGVLSAGAAAVLAATGLFSARLPEALPYPGGAIAFMQAHRLQGNILSDYNWGDYVTYHMWPGSRVFVDTRYDQVYPEKVIRDYLEIFLARPQADRVLQEWPHDYVLMPPGTPAANFMARRVDWKLIYRDQEAELFARAGSAAAKIPGVPIAGTPPPPNFP